MAAVTAPTDIQPGPTANASPPVQYGATIAFGKVVYFDTTDSKHKLAANNSTLNVSAAVGIAVTPGVNTGYGYIVSTPGALVTFTGTTFVVGDTYFLGTSGNIIPQSDLATGNYVTRIGTAYSASILKLAIEATFIAHA